MGLIETIINAGADVSKEFIGQSAFGISVESVITAGVVVFVGAYIARRMGYSISFSKEEKK